MTSMHNMATSVIFLKGQLDDAVRVVDMKEYYHNLAPPKHSPDNEDDEESYECEEGDEKEQPPLDQITVTTSSSTTDHDDEEDDVEETENASECSSVSCDCDDVEVVPSKPRSIFGSYWNKQGLPEAPFFRSSSRCVVQMPPRTIKDPRFVPSPPPSPTQRRSIFASQCHAQSESPVFKHKLSSPPTSPRQTKDMESRPLKNSGFYELLPGETVPSPTPLHEIRKTQSAHAILTKTATTTTKSALKPGRYSGTGGTPTTTNPVSPPPSRSIQRSVSFNDHVAVALVPPSGSMLQEQWAADGWDHWFA